MALLDGLTDGIRRRARDQELPGPVYAVVGATDLIKRRVDSILSAPAAVIDDVRRGYEDLVAYGQDRVVEVGTDRAVRNRITRFEDQVAPRAAAAAVRLQQRRQQLRTAPTTVRATVAAKRVRERARSSASRFAELNAPVLLDDDRQH